MLLNFWLPWTLETALEASPNSWVTGSRAACLFFRLRSCNSCCILNFTRKDTAALPEKSWPGPSPTPSPQEGAVTGGSVHPTRLCTSSIQHPTPWLVGGGSSGTSKTVEEKRDGKRDRPCEDSAVLSVDRPSSSAFRALVKLNSRSCRVREPGFGKC